MRNLSCRRISPLDRLRFLQSTACELEPPFWTAQQSDQRLCAKDPRADVQISPKTLAGQSTNRPIEPITQADNGNDCRPGERHAHQSVEADDVRDSSPRDTTGTPPGVSTVELTVQTLVSRRRSGADIEALTKQLPIPGRKG